MAASRKSKNPSKSVTKDDLRRLMKETRSSSGTGVKRVDHPYAKYNSLGQLSCSLCGSQIKTDKLWTPHIMGRTHKENLVALKQKQQADEIPGPQPPDRSKRKGIPLDDEQLLKKMKGESSNGKGAPAAQPKSILKNAPKSILKNATPQPAVIKSAISIGNYGSSSENSDSDDEPVALTPLTLPTATGTDEGSGTSLPSDFFEPGTSKPVEPAAEEPNARMAEKLPEGFFDDPKQDAKVREVVFVDKMDEEWAQFQKSIKAENTVSEAIMEEDDEQKTVERNIDEIDEQLHRWTQVYDLAKKKEELMLKQPDNIQKEGKQEDSDAEDQEFEEFLDWRSKEAWKK